MELCATCGAYWQCEHWLAPEAYPVLLLAGQSAAVNGVRFTVEQDMRLHGELYFPGTDGRALLDMSEHDFATLTYEDFTQLHPL